MQDTEIEVEENKRTITNCCSIILKMHLSIIIDDND